MAKLTQKPVTPFTRAEKRVSAPSLALTMASMSGISQLSGAASTWSSASSGKMRMPSLLTRSNSNSRRNSGAEWVRAAVVMVTTEMTWEAICCACGARCTTLIMPTQAAMLSVVSTPSNRKVRQNRPLFNQLGRWDPCAVTGTQAMTAKTSSYSFT